MPIRSVFFGLAASFLAISAAAETPKVATDILPVHSLVAQVMQGVGTPSLLMPGGANPHSHAMRPSEMHSLQQADLVVWIGPDLTPWLGDTITRVAPNADRLTLQELEGTTIFQSRDEALFDDHDDQEGHEDHDHDDHESHHHDGIDPHSWLAPENALLWLQEIANQLSAANPEHAALYQSNAQTAATEILGQSDIARAQLAALTGVTILVYHDAYQYFEHSFDLPIAGAIAQSDATKPGAARLGDIRMGVSQAGKICVVAEPQFNPKLINTIAPQGVNIVELDPIGAHLSAGPGHYLALLRTMTAGFLACAK